MTTDSKVDPAATTREGQDVPAGLRLHAEQVVPADTAEAALGRQQGGIHQALVEGVRVETEHRLDRLGQHGDENQQDHDDAARQGDLVPFEARPGDPAERTALDLLPGALQDRFRLRVRRRPRGLDRCRHCAGDPSRPTVAGP